MVLQVVLLFAFYWDRLLKMRQVAKSIDGFSPNVKLPRVGVDNTHFCCFAVFCLTTCNLKNLGMPMQAFSQGFDSAYM